MVAEAAAKTRAVLKPVAFSFVSILFFSGAFFLMWRDVKATVLLILCGFGCLSGIWGFFVELNRRCWPGMGLNLTSFLLNTGLGILVSLALWLKTVPITFL